ncbi:GGDEF domain-containing protein [Roseateles violae]|uniref:diguanylate cyclase n=1 Tax=Roseateles violae TaxID=3058042 RepID=A0ABT8DT61_9BURK|nr:GGDEF domain-containing protein [Pelomonas sp. PFR6]MDN3919351.1 GGDEF domain-containing protein [Pelomonas sp. PFR6]
MNALDAPTLLIANAIFNGFASFCWVLLAGLFRIAPRASWLMAGAHLCCMAAALRCEDCAPLPIEGFADLAALATVALLALALRRMLRLRQHWLDIALIGGAGALAVLWPLPGRSAPLIATSACMSLLALRATRDVVSGAGPGLARPVTVLIALPHLLLGLATGARAAVLLFAPQWTGLFQVDGAASGLLAGLWLALSGAIAISLMALLLWRLIARIQHLSHHDSMTGSLNRRAFDAELRKLQALRRRGHEHAIVLIDIDHFKRINDRLGHAAGDAALIHAVKVLRGCLRDLDLLGRLGGEEFCALLPHTPLAPAAQVAERMRAALEQRPLAWRGSETIALTASFGVAPAQGDDPLGTAGLALADRLVYRAKAEGRNRVCVADAAPVPAAAAPSFSASSSSARPAV